MTTLRCIAVDDEPPALELIADEIEKVPFLEMVGTFHDPMAATSALREGGVELMFLDIRMPEVTGLELLRSLSAPPMVVIASAYAEYALEGFDLDVIDYLLKPYAFDRFLRACNKARWHHQLRRGAPPPGQESQADDERPAPLNEVSADFVFVKSGYDQIRIELADLQYVEGLKDYVKIVHGGVTTLTLLSLKHIAQRLPARQFVRAHRSYIVALRKVEAVKTDHLVVAGREIPIGGSYRDEVTRQVEARHL